MLAKARPVVAFLEPGDIGRRGDDPGLDASVALLYGRVAADERIGEAARRLLGEEQLDIAAQGPLISLEGQHGVGVPVNDLPGDLALAAHRNPRT